VVLRVGKVCCQKTWFGNAIKEIRNISSFCYGRFQTCASFFFQKFTSPLLFLFASSSNSTSSFHSPLLSFFVGWLLNDKNCSPFFLFFFFFFQTLPPLLHLDFLMRLSRFFSSNSNFCKGGRRNKKTPTTTPFNCSGCFS